MSITNKIKNALELKNGVNGLKTILGAALVVASHQIGALNQLMIALPDFSEEIQSVIIFLKGGINILEMALSVSGNGLLSLGLIHKLGKLLNK